MSFENTHVKSVIKKLFLNYAKSYIYLDTICSSFFFIKRVSLII